MTDHPCPQVPALGAYVLGSLNAADRTAVDEHLLDCPTCAAELSELEGLTPLISSLTLDDVTTGLSSAAAPEPSDDLFDRVTAAIDDDNRARTRRRRLQLVGAAAAVAALGAGAGVGVALSSGSSAGQLFQASAGRVHMGVTLDGRSTGTELQVSVAGLPEDEHCRLIAVSTNGSREVAGTWTATYNGAAQVTGWTSFQPGELADVVLLGTDGQQLVKVTT